MKTVMKFLTFGLILAAFGAISVITANAQATDEVCTPLYEKLLANRKGPELEKYKAAVAAGKEFNEKCTTWQGQEDAIKYVAGQVPKLEKIVVELEEDQTYYQPYYKAIPAKDWAKVFNLGKWIVNKNPDDIDHPLVLATIGFDLATMKPEVDTYNNDTISMAKLALQKMEQGKNSGSGQFGNVTGYLYKTKDCADGKTNATGWMNYVIGNIMLTRMKQTKEALPYFYKATQVGCETKDRIANVYRSVGAWYVEEFRLLEAKRDVKYKELQELEKNQDPKLADAEKEYEGIVALQKGYMERVMDAYARAYKSAVNAKEPAAFSNGLLDRSKQFYKFRNGDAPKVTFDSWLASLPTSFPDPTAAVTPIVEAPSTTAPTSMNTVDAPASNGTDTRARTVATKTTTAATTTTAAKTTTTTTTTTKAPAKKPAPKKKGTK